MASSQSTRNGRIGWAQNLLFKRLAISKKKFPKINSDDNLLINGAICPDQKLTDTIRSLPQGYFLIQGQLLIAARNPDGDMTAKNTVHYETPLTIIDRPWKIFRENGAQIKVDFRLLTAGRTSAGISDQHTVVYAEHNLFVEEGVTTRAAITG